MFSAERALMSVEGTGTVDKSMLAEINRLRSMTVADLQVRWRELYGEDSRSRNRDYLWRRVARRLQELQHGGLSLRAKARIAELVPTIDFVRSQVPRGFDPATAPSAADTNGRRSTRDPRLPTPGTVLNRQYRGQ